MDLPHLAQWAKWKGIDILGSGDFTHPDWFKDLAAHLVPAGEGIYRYGDVYFLLTVELSAIWSQAGRVRRLRRMKSIMMYCPSVWVDVK